MEGQQSSGADSEASALNPASVEAHDSPNRESIPNGQQSVAEKALVDRIDRSDRWMIFLTAAIAFSGLISACIFGWQLSVMKGQLKEMRTAREGGDTSSAAQLAQMQSQTTAMQGQLTQMQAASAQTERAIAATNRLAEEAAKTAAESRRLADTAIEANAATKQLAESAVQANQLNVDVQRAFIVSKGLEFEPAVPSLKSALWNGYFLLENSGNTPVLDLRLYIWCIPGAESVPDPYPLLGTTTNDSKIITPIRMVFGAKQARRVGGCLVDRWPTELGMKAFRYIFGRVEYRDVLNPKGTHVTEFCSVVDVPLFDGGTMEKIGMNHDVKSWNAAAHSCETHNCADQGCDKQTQIQAGRDLADAPPSTKKSR